MLSYMTFFFTLIAFSPSICIASQEEPALIEKKNNSGHIRPYHDLSSDEKDRLRVSHAPLKQALNTVYDNLNQMRGGRGYMKHLFIFGNKPYSCELSFFPDVLISSVDGIFCTHHYFAIHDVILQWNEFYDFVTYGYIGEEDSFKIKKLLELMIKA